MIMANWWSMGMVSPRVLVRGVLRFGSVSLQMPSKDATKRQRAGLIFHLTPFPRAGLLVSLQKHRPKGAQETAVPFSQQIRNAGLPKLNHPFPRAVIAKTDARVSASTGSKSLPDSRRESDRRF